MIKCEKYSLLYIKKHKECNNSIILRYTKMHYPPKINNEKKKSYHNFLYCSDRQHKNVPVKIVNPLASERRLQFIMKVVRFLWFKLYHTLYDTVWKNNPSELNLLFNDLPLLYQLLKSLRKKKTNQVPAFS